MHGQNAELAFVEALYDATVRNIIAWKLIPDDDREISQAEVDGDIIEVEFVYFPAATGGTFEIVLARVSGMKTYFQVAVGTPAYQILRSMLSSKQSLKSSIKSLDKATGRVRKLLEIS